MIGSRADSFAMLVALSGIGRSPGLQKDLAALCRRQSAYGSAVRGKKCALQSLRSRQLPLAWHYSVQWPLAKNACALNGPPVSLSPMVDRTPACRSNGCRSKLMSPQGLTFASSITKRSAATPTRVFSATGCPGPMKIGASISTPFAFSKSDAASFSPSLSGVTPESQEFQATLNNDFISATNRLTADWVRGAKVVAIRLGHGIALNQTAGKTRFLKLGG